MHLNDDDADPLGSLHSELKLATLNSENKTTNSNQTSNDIQFARLQTKTQTWSTAHNQGEFEPLATIGYGRLSLAPNGSLVIRNADKLDEANYLCKSSNGIGKGLSWSTSLKVTGKYFPRAHHQRFVRRR